MDIPKSRSRSNSNSLPDSPFQGDSAILGIHAAAAQSHSDSALGSRSGSRSGPGSDQDAVTGSGSDTPAGMNIDFPGDASETAVDSASATAATVTTALAKKKKPAKKEAQKAAADVTASKPRASRSVNNRGERMTFELDDVLRKYSPEQFKTCQAYDVGGVNILNKKPVDSKTALDKIKRRRETHNRVERRRRDCINQLIDELTTLLPKEEDDSLSKCHRVNILRAAVAHIQNLTRQNENLQSQIEALQTGKPMPPPAIITTLAPMMDYEEDLEDSMSFRSESSSTTSYTSHVPRSPLSPPMGLAFSPLSSPIGTMFSSTSQHRPGVQQMEWRKSATHLLPLSHSGSVSSSEAPSPIEQSIQQSGIPMIVEPLDIVSRTEAANSKRLNRQTLPKLQLAPPPFHQHHQHQHHQHQHHHQHHRSNSNGPLSPSFHSGQDSSTSPNSAYSGYSSSTAPWSSSPGPSTGPLSGSSSGFGGGTSPRSPSFSNYGPPSPYSPYEPSSAHAHMSRSPVLAPWKASPVGPGGVEHVNNGGGSGGSGHYQQRQQHYQHH
ncbi:hypothetical protein EDD21DRAFT_419756 [Dissophora ornata]|nr:hypothetical protein EDD21DRAFT_419756 [Dissophora ornata]